MTPIDIASANAYEAPTGEQVMRCRSRRVERVAAAVRRELSELLVKDLELRRALYPEERLGVDSSLTAFASISLVEVDNSIDVAKCWVTVYGDERSKAAVMAGLERKRGYLRSRVAKVLHIRRTPELRFFRDDSVERGDRTLALLAKLGDDSSDFEDEYFGEDYFDSVPRATGRPVGGRGEESAVAASLRANDGPPPDSTGADTSAWQEELDREFAELEASGDLDALWDDDEEGSKR
eukprot:PRCOL_00004217-RA